MLGKIEVEDENIDHLRTFYSCLYRSVLFPRAFYEKNSVGEIVHYSPYNGTIQKGYMFTDTGFWDTFRCLFPLLNLMYPSVNEKIQDGLANTYKESGFLPSGQVLVIAAAWWATTQPLWWPMLISLACVAMMSNPLAGSGAWC